VLAQTGQGASAGPVPVHKMAADANPAFEVATIKPTEPNLRSQGFHSGNGRRIWCDNETVNDIISFAYGVHAKQIVGARSGLERIDTRSMGIRMWRGIQT